MHKIIKFILKSIGWLTLISCLLAFVLTLIINSPGIQEYIISKTFKKFEDKLGNHISYSHVSLRLFNKAQFNDLLITDLQNDTILFAPEFSATFPGIIRRLLFNKGIPMRLGTIAFEDSYFRLNTDSTGVLNIRFIIDTFSQKKDSSKPSTPFYIDRIKIKDSKFSFSRYDTNSKDFGIDYSNMVFNNINLKVNDFISFSDTIDFQIKSLSCIEKSQFKVENFSSFFHLCKSQLYFDDINIETRKSILTFSRIHFDFDSFRDFGGGNFFSQVKMKINCTQSRIYAEEIGFFGKIFRDINQSISLTGNYSGSLDNFKGKDFVLSFGKESTVKGNFNMTGLPDPNSTFLILDIEKFVTTPNDLENLQLPYNKKINLPERLRNIKKYKYSGNFTGFFRDFVSYGTLETDFGNIKTDVMFKPGNGNEILFSGRLSCNQFDVGTFAGMQKFLGKTSLDFTINGKGEINHNFSVDLKGGISLIEVNGYAYQNINVDGNFSQNRFNGKVDIDDPNAKVQFNGLIDLSSEIRRYDFTANVFFAKLYQLNINKKDPDYTASFLINANVSGNNIDSINGRIKLLNSLFSKSDAQIQVYDLQLDIQNDSLLNKISLTSDFLDGTVYGHFRLSQLVDEYLNLIDRYIPAFSLKDPKKQLLSHCDFDYKLNFKNSQPLFNFFIPEFLVDPNTNINGNLERNGDFNSTIHLESPHILAKKTNIDNVILNSQIKDNKLVVDFGCKMLSLNKRLILTNFTLESDIDSNHASFITRWNNWDSALYKGNLVGDLHFLNQPGQKLITKIDFDNSSLVLNDSAWAIEPFSVLFDSNKCVFNNLELRHNDEYVRANGILSDNTNDSLICDFNSFNFSILNFIIRSSTFKFDGLLSGKASITGFKKPLFFASMNIKDFSINDEIFGDTYVKSKWDNSRKAVVIDADIMRGKLKTIKITGDYYPLNKSALDLKLNLDKFKVEALNPYLKMVFDNIKGVATGELDLTGSLTDPIINGDLNMQKVAFTVSYLKTRYNFTSNISFSNNNIIFDNTEVHDVDGNIAILNGVIHTEYFRKYNLGLTLVANKYLFLDTKENDNPMFYGKAYASGIVKLSGEPSSLKFDVTAQTEPGTIFSIPVTDQEELSSYSFIKYISNDTVKQEKAEEEYKVNLTGMQLNFDMKITPDATMRIVFDPAMGDIIEGKGSGDLDIAINTIGDFTINGLYEIESGKYPFTLQNVIINRTFTVEKGSTLRWTGDPINADVNINTYYEANPVLSQLDERITQTIGGASLSGSTKTNESAIQVNCELKLLGKLMQPDIKMDIYLPNADQNLRDQVASRMTTEEEKTKQFIALVFLNRFLYAGTNTQDQNISSGDIAGVNASEVLSNQLSNWLSQLSDQVDIGVKYRPNTKMSQQEFEIILSKEFLNNRLIVHSSVDMRSNASTTNGEAQNATSIVGDVDIDYKITKSGRLRTKAYNRANEYSVESELSGYTQGVGIFYTEEFDKIGEIPNRYKDAIKERKKNKKKEKPTAGNEAIKEEEVKAN